MVTQTQIADAVALLFGVLDSDAQEEFERICIEQCLLIRCQCGENVSVDAKRCEDCGLCATCCDEEHDTCGMDSCGLDPDCSCCRATAGRMTGR